MLIERIFGGSSQFRQNFLKIASASLLAQVLGLISLPFLTRLFSSSEFGILTTYTMVQSICLAGITGRIDWIIPNAKTDKQAQNLIGLGLLISVFATLVLAVISMSFSTSIAAILKIPPDHIFLKLLPVGLIAGAFQLLFQAWFIFQGDLTTVGWAKLGQAITTLVISLLAGILSMTTNGLVFAYVSGFVTAAVILVWKSNIVFSSYSPLHIKRHLKRLNYYGTQILSTIGLSLTNICLTMSLIILILVFYGNTILGWYGLVFRVATAPISLITTALVQSFWSDAARLVKTDPRQLWTFYKSSTLRLFILAIPMTIVFLCAPLYIGFIFGAEWDGAGIILASVTPYLFGMIVFSPTTHLIVYSKTHWQLLCDVITLIGSIFVFSIFALSGKPASVAILGSSLVMLVGYSVRFLVHLKANRQAVLRIKSQP